VTAFLCGLALAVMVARADEPEAAVRISPEPARQPVLAIMGEVARPGVFELSISRPQLLDLVSLAGGTTPEASGSVRIIRGGRPGWQAWLTPATPFPLRPDDLVIVDSVRPPTDRRFTADTEIAPEAGRRSATSRPASEFVQLGIVRLIPRPVVLDVAREQASMKSVLSLLHQPLRDRGAVTVVKPAGGIQIFERDQPQDVSLPTGSVLIFDPATVSAAVLPQLPPTVRLDAAGTALAAAPASIPDPVAESPTGDAFSSTDTTEPGARIEFVPRKLPANHSATARRSARSARPPVAGQGAPKGSPLNGLLTVAAILSSAIVLHWLRRNGAIAQVAKRMGRPTLEFKQWLNKAVAKAPQAAETSQSQPQKHDTSGYPLQEPLYRVDVAQVWNGPYSPIDRPVPPRPRARVEPRVRELPTGRPERKIRIDSGHLPGSAGALDRALSALDDKRPSRS